MGPLKTRAIAICAGLAIVGALGTAAAEEERDASWYQKAFETWSTKLVTLEKRDATRAGAEEVATVRTLIGQGQAYLASERTEEIDPLLERAEAIAALADAKIIRVEAEKEAQDAEAKAAEAEKAAQDATAAAEAVQSRYEELEAKGL